MCSVTASSISTISPSSSALQYDDPAEALASMSSPDAVHTSCSMAGELL
ncbi:hypothetical protein PC118_g21373 [Phytophthora cactorum]|uniref:Uncharacterized protein n=1 Tax=Phytophthora cactorum TaxID=29920 RepID=A0A8T1F1F7_9STRA|nr:hypothetical protein PC112_g21562 [Phytophthora cactorum]KAG2877071.1 hypothetical protein PC114_g23848 [Phytophthora cactorum]KAG2962542.1 hypothetical protein PC118_g21373 [Phytophthora cactorum]KAG2971412.1 hypothetical protein PC119_g23396 [Phytophthora cactorum]KAG2989762.1 hypothetical protein PC120_g23097 [Phytophthora cactorum]